MIWHMRTSVWFGITLAAVLLFLWCLMAMIEAEAPVAGYTWGLIVFGAIAIVAGAVALVGQAQAGGVPRSRDALGDTRPSAAPRQAAGRDLGGSGYRPHGTGEVPRASWGRSIT